MVFRIYSLFQGIDYKSHSSDGVDLKGNFGGPSIDFFSKQYHFWATQNAAADLHV